MMERRFLGWGFLGNCFYTQRFFYILYVFNEAKLAKFIRFEAGWKMIWDEMRDARCEIRVFLSKSSPSIGEMIVFLSALRNIGNCEDVKLKYFAF